MLGSNKSAGGSDELLNPKARMSAVQGSKESEWGEGGQGRTSNSLRKVPEFHSFPWLLQVIIK